MVKDSKKYSTILKENVHKEKQTGCKIGVIKLEYLSNNDSSTELTENTDSVNNLRPILRSWIGRMWLDRLHWTKKSD